MSESHLEENLEPAKPVYEIRSNFPTITCNDHSTLSAVLVCRNQECLKKNDYLACEICENKHKNHSTFPMVGVITNHLELRIKLIDNFKCQRAIEMEDSIPMIAEIFENFEEKIVDKIRGVRNKMISQIKSYFDDIDFKILETEISELNKTDCNTDESKRTYFQEYFKLYD